MSIITKSAVILALAVPLFCTAPASAATYKLAIKGGSAILKIFLDNGVARRAGTTNNTAMFDVEMNGSECQANLRLAFANGASTIPVQYDVCSEKGFSLTWTRGPF